MLPLDPLGEHPHTHSLPITYGSGHHVADGGLRHGVTTILHKEIAGLCPVGSTPSLLHCRPLCRGYIYRTVAAFEPWLSSRALYACTDGHLASCATLSWLHPCRPHAPCVRPAACQQTQWCRAQPCHSAGTRTKALALVRLLSTVLPYVLRALLNSTLASQCRHHAWAPGSQTPIAITHCPISGLSERLLAAAPECAPRPYRRMLDLRRSPLHCSAHLVHLLLESTLVSQCRHNAMAPGSRSLVAVPSERLPATSLRHNTTGASP